MNELTANVNWIAVVVGAVVAFLLGGLWYSPKVFGKKWAEGVGVNPDDSKHPPAVTMLVQVIGTFLLAWVVGITETRNALLTIILIVITIAVLMAAGGLFANKSRYAIMVEAGYVIAMGFIMVAFQAIF